MPRRNEGRWAIRQSITCCAAALLTALVLAGCGASTQGPTTWLDRPLDGATLPLGPVTVQAHASDADGVVSFEFFVDDVPLVTAPAPGGRLGEATVGWRPTEPGTYTIRARGIDTQGNVGTEATSVVTVGELPTASPTSSPPAEGGEIIFLVEPETIPAGECAVLYWEVRPPAEALLDGEGVPPTGEREVCPNATRTYELLVPETGEMRTIRLHVEPQPEPTGTPSPTATRVPPTGTPLPPTFSPTTAPPSPRPTIVSFQANPPSIVQGQCTTLSWAVEGALTGVWLEGEGVGDHDARDKCPGSTTTYTLVARSPGGEDTDSLTVTVTERPSPTPTVTERPSPTPTVTEPPSPTPTPNLVADLAVTDLYPETLYGPVYGRLTNHGPGTVTNAIVQFSCQWDEIVDPIEGIHNPGQIGPSNITITSLSPGQTTPWNTGIDVDLHQYQYDITCSVSYANDPNPGNNTYPESFP